MIPTIFLGAYVVSTPTNQAKTIVGVIAIVFFLVGFALYLVADSHKIEVYKNLEKNKE